MVSTLALAMLGGGPSWADPGDDHFTIAAQHYASSRWDLAAQEFEALLAEFPEHVRVRQATFYLGETLLQLQRYAEARTHFQQLVQRWPTDRHARQATFRAAEMAFLAGDHATAQPEFEQFGIRYSDDPLNAYALAYRGELALDVGDAEAAGAIFREAIQRFSDGPLKSETRFGLARALEQQGSHVEALRFYQFIAEHTDGNLRDDAHLRAGIILFKQQQFTAAIEMLAPFDGDLAGSTLRDEARYWTGLSWLKSGDAEQAATIFANVTQLAVDHPLAAAYEFGWGDALRASGDATAAAEHYTKLIQQWPTSEWADDARYALCEIYFEQNDAESFARHAAEFRTAHADSPFAPRVEHLAGRLALRQKRYDEAIRRFEPLAELDADPPTAVSRANRYYLGVAYLAAKRPHDAWQVLREIVPSDEEAELRDHVAVAKSNALLGLERYEEAVAPLLAYLEAQPQGLDAAACRAKLTICYVELNRPEQFQQAFRQFRDIDAHSEHFLPTVAYLADRTSARGDTEFARELYALLTADGNSPDDVAKGLAGLGRLQLQRGDAAGSAKTFERLLDKAATSSEAPQAGLLRARSLERTQHEDAALAAYRLVMENYPTSAEAPVAMFEAAKLHDRLGQDREARELLDQLLVRQPPFDQLDAVLYQRAWVLLDLDEQAQAEAAFERLIREFPQSSFWADATYRLAERAFQTQDVDRARTLLDQLLRTDLDPRLLGHVMYMQGQVAAQDGRWEDVVSAMQRIVDDLPQDSLRLPALYWVAEATFRQEDYVTAGQRFAELDELVGDSPASWVPMISLRQAQVLAHQQQWSEALALGLTMGERFPEFRQLYEADYLIGRCLSMQGRFAESREAFTRVVRSTTGSRTETAAMAQWMIGESYFHQRAYRDAIRAYHRVVGLYSYPQWQAAALLQAGKCHEQSEEWRESVKLYTQLLRDYPSTTYAQEASQRLRVAQQQTVPGTTN